MTGHDPGGPWPQFKGGWCGNASCRCARPKLPCDEFKAMDNSAVWCGQCSWNQAGHNWPEKHPQGITSEREAELIRQTGGKA